MATKSTQKRKNYKKNNIKQKTKKESNNFIEEVVGVSILGTSILLILSNIGMAGSVGRSLSGLIFGVFGFVGHIVPVYLLIACIYGYTNRKDRKSMIKLVATVVAVISICSIIQLFTGTFKSGETIVTCFEYSREYRRGGGLLGACLTLLLYPALGAVGSMLIFLMSTILSVVIITEKSFMDLVKNQSTRAVLEVSKKHQVSSNNRSERKKEYRQHKQLRDEQRKKEIQEGIQDSCVPMNAKDRGYEQQIIKGVTFDTTLSAPNSSKLDLINQAKTGVMDLNKPLEEMNEVEAFHATYNQDLSRGIWGDEQYLAQNNEINTNNHSNVSYNLGDDQYSEPILQEGIHPIEAEFHSQEVEPERVSDITQDSSLDDIKDWKNRVQLAPDFLQEDTKAPTTSKKESQEVVQNHVTEITQTMETQGVSESSYKFPPISLLSKGPEEKAGSDIQLRQTAMQLEEVLQSFGVKVKVTQYSKGPSVTRYELQPEKGVKVSKIVGLVDDIKLNLAAPDIRIEAPIPGKAAVGIEVPNKENSIVSLRSLLESSQFKNHESNIAFAAGKDIGGQAVVTDIAKMPHVLIAGSTGSGKSVCINTLIMSILYKANPEDVKLIMIDPKVVELSVYNGIPHLLIPVVTDPKKAAGALHWAVAEMTKRYQLFADYNVRDLKGYNEKIKTIAHIEDETKPEKMPHIVVIVDELADLMMVAPGDVEEAICRLAQLARAAGIHLILATQRPSVNVITGLIKANMPSRIAFAVSSGVDSRTIIDMNGAEKLLGKGDMLFYPAGYPKPTRVQGAFVSDKEVHSVVEFLKEQEGDVQYNQDIQKEVSSSATNIGNIGASGTGNQDELDAYFQDAGKFIIEKDKASIGMLQRNFKVGFNRAARIMDQLADAGVVGEEEGTKPRKVQMSISEFEQYIEDYV